MNLQSIRDWQIGQLEKGSQIISSLLADVPAESLTKYRDTGDGWTVLEVMCHLRDYEELFLHRAKITVEQDNPDLPNPDPDKLAAENHYAEQDIGEVLSTWKASRVKLVEFMKGRTETDWECVAKHPRRGPFTLHDQLFLTVWHDTNHLEQITRILAEKR